VWLARVEVVCIHHERHLFPAREAAGFSFSTKIETIEAGLESLRRNL
jgi:hypothetical protein